MSSKFDCGTPDTGVDHTTLNTLKLFRVSRVFNVFKVQVPVQPKPFNFENFEIGYSCKAAWGSTRVRCSVWEPYSISTVVSLRREGVVYPGVWGSAIEL